MVDVMDIDKRSALMSRIRSKNTRPEQLTRKYLWHAGFRYRLHPRELVGRPDLVLPRWKVVVFVHGCFWHRHECCPYFRLPTTRRSFWNKKLRGNQRRDAQVIASLLDEGWRVAVVWECAVRTDPDKVGKTLSSWIRRGQRSVQIEGSCGEVVSSHLVST